MSIAPASMPFTQPPRDDDNCGWSALLPAPPSPRRLIGRQRIDCAIVGAGFTGLAVARRLAAHRPEWRIAILEAQRVSSGASGRNSGFVVDVAHYDARRGVEGNRRFCRLARAGFEQLRALVREHRIDCEWREHGRLHVAAGPPGLRALDHFLSGLRAMGESYEELDRAGIRAITGSEHYRAGARTSGGATMQPAALVRGLAAHLPSNVELYEESAVRAIGDGPPFALELADGAAIADRVFLATNGYSAALGFLARRIFPLFTFASLTRPLDDREQQVLTGEREWGAVCEEPFGATVRRMADRRILIRNTVRYTGGVTSDRAFLSRVGEEHARAFRARFPMLERVTLENTWGGILGISMNGVPFFGELRPSLFAAAGYNGVGVALGTAVGTLLADLAVGADSPLLDDIRALATPAWIPPEPLLGVAVRATLAYRRSRAREEM